MSRTYTQEEREKALALCVESGQYRASRELGIPQSTLEGWVRKAGLRSIGEQKMQAAIEAREIRIAAKRAGVREKLINLTDETLDRIGAPVTVYVGGGRDRPPIPVALEKPPAGECKDLATTVGILIDKFRLESGEVTSRSEVSVDDVATSRERLTQQLARIAERRGALERTFELN